MTVFYVFLLGVAAFGALAYVLFFMSHVPGAKDERFGRLEPLPPDLGQWKLDEESSEAKRAEGEGLRREERHIYEESSGFGAGKLIRQVRYRSRDTNEIVRVEPEQVVPRRRIKN